VFTVYTISNANLTSTLKCWIISHSQGNREGGEVFKYVCFVLEYFLMYTLESDFLTCGSGNKISRLYSRGKCLEQKLY